MDTALAAPPSFTVKRHADPLRQRTSPPEQIRPSREPAGNRMASGAPTRARSGDAIPGAHPHPPGQRPSVSHRRSVPQDRPRNPSSRL